MDADAQQGQVSAVLMVHYIQKHSACAALLGGCLHVALHVRRRCQQAKLGISKSCKSVIVCVRLQELDCLRFFDTCFRASSLVVSKFSKRSDDAGCQKFSLPDRRPALPATIHYRQADSSPTIYINHKASNSGLLGPLSTSLSRLAHPRPIYHLALLAPLQQLADACKGRQIARSALWGHSPAGARCPGKTLVAGQAG